MLPSLSANVTQTCSYSPPEMAYLKDSGQSKRAGSPVTVSTWPQMHLSWKSKVNGRSIKHSKTDTYDYSNLPALHKIE